MPQRVLSEAEYNAVKQKVLASLPDNWTQQDFERQIGPRMEQALGEAENTPATPEGSALGRFASNAAELLNPVTIVSGLAQAVQHPIDTAKGILAQQGEQVNQAIENAKQGRFFEALGHSTAAALPILGPLAAQAGTQIAEGDYAGGVGKAAGLLTPFAAQKLLELRTAGKTGQIAADTLERQAADQVAGKVLAPGNVRFKGRAQAIAPEILKRGMTGDRIALQQAAEEGMAESGAKLDAAIQAKGGTQAPIPVAEITSRLQDRIDALKDSTGQPLSEQAATRIKLLNDRVAQVKSLTNTAPSVAGQGALTFDDLKRIRDENYRIADEARAYEKAGNPAMSDVGFASRETGSAIREAFAARSPESAAANADYSFFKTLNDTLDPALGRPKVLTPSSGITGGQRTIGAVAGNLIGGPKVAFVMSVVLPWLKERTTNAGWQLADAQSKMKLAEAIRNGDQPLARRMMLRITKYAPRATSPSESQTDAVPVTQP